MSQQVSLHWKKQAINKEQMLLVKLKAKFITMSMKRLGLSCLLQLLHQMSPSRKTFSLKDLRFATKSKLAVTAETPAKGKVAHAEIEQNFALTTFAHVAARRSHVKIVSL